MGPARGRAGFATVRRGGRVRATDWRTDLRARALPVLFMLSAGTPQTRVMLTPGVGLHPVTSRFPPHEDHVRAVLALHPSEHFLPVLDLTHSVRFGRRSRDLPAMVVQLTE